MRARRGRITTASRCAARSSGRVTVLLTLHDETAIDDGRPVGRPGVLVGVVPVPPLVRRRLRVALRRVLPVLLTPKRGDVEVIPRAPHLLVAAVVDEVGAKHLVVVRADERVRAVPFVDAE